MGYELLEEAGLVTAETAYYDVVLDYGEGPAASLEADQAHNYYLYHNPATGQLDFISWDHDMILGAGPGGGGRRGGMASATSFDLAEIDAGWPLIRYLLDDPDYQARYQAQLEAFGAIFDADTLTARYRVLADVIEPTIARTADVAAFEAAVESLIQTTETRDAALDGYLTTASR